MDAVSGVFLNTLNTDMAVMEGYFPFLGKAFTVMQYSAWAMLFLITVWELFKNFGGPISESEPPFQLLARSAVFGFLIGNAKPIFQIALDIATAPYTALMEIEMGTEDFTFAGLQETITNGLVDLVVSSTVVGEILMLILLISLGWNYFKLLLQTVERYVVVGVLSYTSPLAYCMGGAKATNSVFKSWCRMVGAQLVMLVMNVWFLRGFDSSVGQFVGNGGALNGGKGNMFLWLFCALAFLKVAQRFDSYLGTLGMNVAQTGSAMGMEMLMAARVIGGMGGGGMKSAGSIFKNAATAAAGGASTASAAATAQNIASGFTSRFKPNSYVRDSVVNGGVRMGASGGLGFAGRAFGGMAARNGATLTGESIASVASRSSKVSGSIGGEIADRSLSNFMPQFGGHELSGTEITGGHISTTATNEEGKSSDVQLFSADQYEPPACPHSIVSASDGSQWYQTAAGAGKADFFPTPEFTGTAEEAGQITSTFPKAESGTLLRTAGEGLLAASTPAGDSIWFSSGFFEEPEAPHGTITDSSGVDWYTMEPHGSPPSFDPGTENGAEAFNLAQFQNFMPGFTSPVSSVDGMQRAEGRMEVLHPDGSGTAFYDASLYRAPRGDSTIYEDKNGHQWYAIQGTPHVEHHPVYQDGKPVYEEGKLKTESIPSVRYSSTPQRYAPSKPLSGSEIKAPKRRIP